MRDGDFQRKNLTELNPDFDMLGFPFQCLPAIASGKETQKPGKGQAQQPLKPSTEAAISGVSKRART